MKIIREERVLRKKEEEKINIINKSTLKMMKKLIR
jgi:hypothetical protein